MFHFMRANSTCKINLGGDTQYSALLCLNKGNNNNKKRWTLPNLSDNNTSVKQSSDVLKKNDKRSKHQFIKSKSTTTPTCTQDSGKIIGIHFCSMGGSKLAITSWLVGVISRKMAAHRRRNLLEPCSGSLATFFSSSTNWVGKLA